MYLLVTLIDGRVFTVPIPTHKEVREVVLQVRDSGLHTKKKKQSVTPDQIQAIKVEKAEE